MEDPRRNLEMEQKTKGLNPEEQDRKDRLEELKRTLPHRGFDGLTDEEKGRLSKYLIMRLFEEPLTPEQMEDYDYLLHKDKDVVRDVTPAEHDRMKELVNMMFRGVELEPDEE